MSIESDKNKIWRMGCGHSVSYYYYYIRLCDPKYSVSRYLFGGGERPFQTNMFDQNMKHTYTLECHRPYNLAPIFPFELRKTMSSRLHIIWNVDNSGIFNDSTVLAVAAQLTFYHQFSRNVHFHNMKLYCYKKC